MIRIVKRTFQTYGSFQVTDPNSGLPIWLTFEQSEDVQIGSPDLPCIYTKWKPIEIIDSYTS